MSSVFSIIIVLAAIAVLGSLALGIIGMVKTDTPPEKQNKMMQYRIGFQFIALILLGLMFALK